jgi:glycosyltransferase involved in cell wall biosynthesis
MCARYPSLVRIVHVIARFNQGGTAGWLNVLIQGQRLEGHEVVLLAGNVQAKEVEDGRFAELGGLHIQGLGRSISIFQDLKVFWALRKLLLEIDPDLINTHTAKAGLVGRLAARSIFKSKIAVVHTFHGHILYGYFGRIKTNIFIQLEKILCRLTDVILVSGLKVKKELISKNIGREAQFIVIRPGVPPIKNISRNTVRQKLSISEDRFTIGWLGRLTDIKRPDRVLKLAELLPNYIFLLGGDGELLESLRQKAPKNVILTGWTTPDDIWSASDIALLTSANEAQPISLVEAGMAGLPLIGEDVGSVSEVIQNAVNGYLTHDLDSRIKAIQKLASDPELRHQMGEAAKKTAVELFGVGQFLDTHKLAYEKAIKIRINS